MLLRSTYANTKKKEEAELKSATSKIAHVTVYQHNAPGHARGRCPRRRRHDGAGRFAAAAANGQHVPLFRGQRGAARPDHAFRLRPVKEDIREEVRKAEAQVKQLQEDGQKSRPRSRRFRTT